ncbi:VOC family protein [uncultured Shewanella sp.]|uniref:VOC family protein n=1 Tax=uncultured Shewanella sp. TaxID=173975 RepID=UPI002618174B|nr:VOC family protein [uncultured Shewanella sp.]
MIQLEHINLVVKDISRSLHFYQAIFPHWRIRGGDKGSWYGKPRNWVHFGDDYQYLSLNDSGEGENRDLSGHQVGLAHFAFVTHDLQGIINRLKAIGYDVDKEGADSRHRENVYYIDPDGYEVEFVQYKSDVPSERNLYD